MLQDAAPDAVSVIVVSRHRPEALRRCLLALAQQDHRCFEVIVVADPEGLAAARASGVAARLIGFDEANLSAARNLGLAQAAAPLVAFIDDDAVAEPSWISRLTAPFANSGVIAATGFVRGRNGISYQWRAAEVDSLGQDHAIEVPEAASLHQGTPARAIKTQGTNCAFRRDALLAIGGFDPAFRFYLDEADVNLRMAGLGLTAVVPLAEVHHSYAASAYRRADRVPLSLRQIAASTAVFLRRHAAAAVLVSGHAALVARESARVAVHLGAGRIDKAAAEGLLASLEVGWAEGLARPLTAFSPLAVTKARLMPLPGTGPAEGRVIAGWLWQRRSLLARARTARAEGLVVSVICLAPSPRAHRVFMDDDGIWVQQGGLWGWSTREGPRFRLAGFGKRVAEETRRIAPFRPVE